MNESSGITVLSLCDGMSCGRIALTELGVKVNRYYASEIDKHCIKQTQLNFPDTIQLGDIEPWREWDIDWATINLVLAGTPCTGFSFCGKMLNFEDPQSRLFWVFADILNHVKTFNPGVCFLFENVRMKKWCVGVISKALNIWPVEINSALVSAQERKRYYWSNIRVAATGLFKEDEFNGRITDIPQPRDRRLFLKDILEDNVDEKYFISGKVLDRILKALPRIMPDKSYCLTSRDMGQKRNVTLVIDTNGIIKKNQQKASRLVAGGHGAGNHSDMDLILQLGRGFNKGGIHSKYPTLLKSDFNSNAFVIQLNPSKASGGVQPYQQDRIYDVSGKSPALMARMSCGAHAINTKSNIRRLTPAEFARLQTVPEWYRWECSNTQIYKMCGNGWTIRVITHILSYMKI